MTVAELIEFLKTHPQDMPVAINMYSETCMLDAKDITVRELSVSREDGWVHDKRPDKPSQLYLVFPGN